MMNTNELRIVGNIAKEKSLSDSGQITAGKMLNRAADEIDRLYEKWRKLTTDDFDNKQKLIELSQRYPFTYDTVASVYFNRAGQHIETTETVLQIMVAHGGY